MSSLTCILLVLGVDMQRPAWCAGVHMLTPGLSSRGLGRMEGGGAWQGDGGMGGGRQVGPWVGQTREEGWKQELAHGPVLTHVHDLVSPEQGNLQLHQ